MDIAEDPALLLALLDAAVDAIVVSDRQGTILRLNSSAAELFGRDAEDLRGQNVRVLMPPGMAVRHDGFMHHYLSTGERRIIGIGRDVEGQRADGTVFPLHLSVGRADIAGDVAFVAILHDLSERKVAEESAARSQRMDAIGQMTGGIAHDFNNLLTVVIGNLELLQETKTAGKAGALISDALEAAELGADLTSRLMVFARKSPLAHEIIDLNDVVAGSISMLRRTLGPRTELNSAFARDLWLVRTDPTQLQTAVLNLVLNAQDAMPGGGRVFLETQNIQLDDTYVAQDIGVSPGRYIRLTVSDSGEGMSPETRIRAIEPFFTTKPPGRGTGMGLSMVYGLVKQSGGHMTIYSEPGQGTTISLYFPATSDSADAAGPAPSDAADALFGAGRRVLVVEDDARVLRLTTSRLRALGFECLTAQSGDAAWALLQTRDDIALVFTDLVMPGTLSGHDLACRIAAARPQVRVLITSGFSEAVLPGGRVEAAFEILRKPYRQADLARALQNVLAER
ncbi:PAS domain S-box protein [Maribius pontilimi]|uniref:Sensor protein FixL n=1 Tax=Palleronia pontilimi TaxID=1964209 RepID=A0A934IIS3_9RHOB|nr:PAS domain S-box protein [Palleronia pontilimi]MBJ3763693.1 PAS domain S-box protein [Palleronia pontilimi]